MDEFFPTPEHIAEEMWKALDDRNSVLEPSAGHGALIDWITERANGGLFNRWVMPNRVDVVECDPDRQFVLRGKGYSLVGDDFMAFEPTRRYDGIIMNPPFSVGAKHLLRAWELLAPGGRVVCLLNAETVRNAYTRERQLLRDIIGDYGRVDDIGQCFVDAERRTAVEVVMVVMDKPDKDIEFGFFDELASDGDMPNVGVDEAHTDAIMQPDVIRDLVQQYNKALDGYRDLLRAKNKVMFYVKGLGNLTQEDVIGKDAGDTSLYNEFVDQLNAAAWDQIFDRTAIQKFVTAGVRDDFDKFRSDSKLAAFTEENILLLLRTLGSNVSNIMEEALLRCFDALTKYDKKNRVHWEGWKSNDFYKVNKRVIIPYLISEHGYVSYGFRTDVINDLDRVLCNITGKRMEDVQTILTGLHEAAREHIGPCSGEFESEFFNVRYFKKGTVHLLWKDLELLERFNRAAAEGKNWLPGER